MSSEHKIYGKTGILDKDGILTPEKQALLDRMQRTSAMRAFEYLDVMEDGDLFPEFVKATGFGKGKIIHLIIEEQMRRNPSSKVLLIAGTKNILVDQTHNALSVYQITHDDDGEYIESEDSDTDVGIEENPVNEFTSILYKTGKIGKADASVHIATIQALQSKVKRDDSLPSQYDLVIVDEVHNIGTVKRKQTIGKFEKVVGFTATPHRSSGQFRTPEQYGFTILEDEELTLPDAQNLGFLPPLVGIQIDTKDIVEEIPMQSNGKIDFRKLEKLLKQSPDLYPYIADRVANIITGEGRNYKTVIAVNFVWEAQLLAQLLHKKGIKIGLAVNQAAARLVHTDEIPAIGTIVRYGLPEEDKESLQGFVSPYIAGEGFDAPFTEVLVWASPTDSGLRYTQYTGRLARRAPGKRFGIVVDCLYQTNKYRWSYNMGMWMKGYVRQLDSGLLWLGPESEIGEISNLPQAQMLRPQTDLVDIQDPRYEELLDIQENDLQLDTTGARIFFGNKEKMANEIKELADELEKVNPELFDQRISGRYIVKVCTDKQFFINKALEKGYTLKRAVTEDNEDEKDTDFPLISYHGRGGFDIFSGGKKPRTLKRLYESVDEFKAEYPYLFKTRRSGTRSVDVCTDRELLINFLLEKGFKLTGETSKDLKGLRENEISLAKKGLKRNFTGSKESLEVASRSIVDKYPNMVASRISGQNEIEVFTDRELFITEMLARGFKLKE